MIENTQIEARKVIENIERHNLKVYKLCVYNWSIQRKVERELVRSNI